MNISVLYSRIVGMPDDCQWPEFGDPSCVGHREVMETVARRYADAVALVVTAGVRTWLDQRGFVAAVVVTRRHGEVVAPAGSVAFRAYPSTSQLQAVWMSP